jgi:3',5'-cyclic AMP phosphodiesterase CpdA
VTVLLQVSDTHFGTEQPPVVQALERLARHQRPDLLVLSGDITQRATARQFAAARAFCDRLGAPALLAIPGNHDIPLFALGQRLLRPYARFQAAFGPAMEGEWSADGLLVVTLNTTRPWRHKDGTLSRKQVDHVLARMARAEARQLRVVVVHQPLAVMRPQDAPDLLHGHAAALRRWAEGGVDIVMGGHIHLPYVLAAHERDASLKGRLWVVQAGTAVSRRVRHEAGNSVNLLRRTPGEPGGRLERWDYDTRTGEFTLAAQAALALNRA